MTDRNFTTTITVTQNPADVFAAINNVRGWWSEEIEGHADKVGETFKHHYKDLHRCEIVVKDLVPGEKVVWTVLDNYFSFPEDKTEWKGTDIVFEIVKRGDKTEVKFTHVGLVPEYECYDVCSDGWRTLIKGSLHDLITSGQDQTDAGAAVADNELSGAR
jgi:hypothetical protein